MSKISNVITMFQLLQSRRKYSIKDLSKVKYWGVVKKLYKYNGGM